MTNRPSKSIVVSLAVLAAFAGASSLASGASAATLGSTRVGASSSGGVFCGGFTSCALVQKSLPAGLTRAPFSGTIRSWRVNVDSPGSLQLLVLRKHSDGTFTAVTGSGVKAPTTPGVQRYRASLKIRKHEFIGLNLLDEDVTIFVLSASDPAFLDGFKPAFDIADRQLPYRPFSSGQTELLLNARVRR